MSTIPNPTKPREVVCFAPFEIKISAGNTFMFFALDIYSKFLMASEGQLKLGPAEIMKAVRVLMDHEDFSRRSTPFTLVMDIGEDIMEELNIIVEPYQGKVVFDKEYLEMQMLPKLDTFFQDFNLM